MTLERFEELEDLVERMRRLQRIVDASGLNDFYSVTESVLRCDRILRESFIALVEGQLAEVEEAFRNA